MKWLQSTETPVSCTEQPDKDSAEDGRAACGQGVLQSFYTRQILPISRNKGEQGKPVSASMTLDFKWKSIFYEFERFKQQLIKVQYPFKARNTSMALTGWTDTTLKGTCPGE